MYIKKNMFKNMKGDMQWGPIYSGKSTDLSSLRDELEFTWEKLMKRMR